MRQRKACPDIHGSHRAPCLYLQLRHTKRQNCDRAKQKSENTIQLISPDDRPEFTHPLEQGFCSQIWMDAWNKPVRLLEDSERIGALKWLQRKSASFSLIKTYSYSVCVRVSGSIRGHIQFGSEKNGGFLPWRKTGGEE